MTIDHAAPPTRAGRHAAPARPDRAAPPHANWPQIRDELVRAHVGDLAWQRLYAPSAAPPPTVAYGFLAATAGIALILIAGFDSVLLIVAGAVVAAVGVVIGGLILVGHVEHEKEYAEDSARVADADELVTILNPSTTGEVDQRPLEYRLGSFVGEALLHRPLDRAAVVEALDLAQRLHEIAATRHDARPNSRLRSTPAEQTQRLDRAAEALIPRIQAFAEGSVA